MNKPNIWIDIKFVISELRIMRRQVQQELLTTIEETKSSQIKPTLQSKQLTNLKKSECNLDYNETLESSPQIEFINHLKPQQKQDAFQSLNRNQTIKNLPKKDMIVQAQSVLNRKSTVMSMPKITDFELDDYLSQIQQQINSVKSFNGLVILKNENRDILVHIENKKIYFYSTEKRALFEKIKLKLDRQFFKDTPNPDFIKKLSKKL